MKFDRALFGVFLLSAIVALSVMSGRAEAQDASLDLPPMTWGFEFTWTDPTEREDDTPFDAATEAGEYRAECTRGEWAEAAFVVFSRAETSGDGNERAYSWIDAVSQGGFYNCRLNIADANGLVSSWSAVITVRKVAMPRPPVLYGGQ